MNNKDEILMELQDTSPILAQISRSNVFTVPEGYFENLGERLLVNALLNIPEGEAGNESNHSQQVPSGYFDQLSDSILSKIKNAEKAALAGDYPLLDSLKKENVYSVPEAYFENLSSGILAAIKPKAKIISFTKSIWWKYAAAAFFAGIMLVSAFFIFNSGSKQSSVYVAATQKYQTLKQINNGIATLPEDEIIQYLELNSRSTDNELLIKNVNTNDLPSEMDYLLDENALNGYLNKINFENQ